MTSHGGASRASKRVLILGATSRVAQDVARLYTDRGATLVLVGRDDDKLSAIARDCKNATKLVADFSDLDANVDVIERAFAFVDGFDVALIAHGDLGDQLASEHDFDEAHRILTVNFTSVVSLLIPLANKMEARGKGTIGVITSVAGDRGRPRNYTYGAAKGALNVYLQGLRSRLFSTGVRVTTLKLGPVDTPMTKDHEKNALFATPERAAKDIVSALDDGTPEAYVPFYWRGIMPVVKNAPERLFQRLPFLSGR